MLIRNLTTAFEANIKAFSKGQATPQDVDVAADALRKTLDSSLANGWIDATEAGAIERAAAEYVGTKAAFEGTTSASVNASIGFDPRALLRQNNPAPGLGALSLRMSLGTPVAGRPYVVSQGDTFAKLAATLQKDAAFKAFAAADIIAVILNKSGLAGQNDAHVNTQLEIPLAAEVASFTQAARDARATEIAPGTRGYVVKAGESPSSLALDLIRLHPAAIGALDPTAPTTEKLVADAILKASGLAVGYVLQIGQPVNIASPAEIAATPTTVPMAGRPYIVQPGDFGVSVIAAKLMASDPSAFAQKTQAAVERAIVKGNGLGNAANPIVILGAQLTMPKLTEIV